MANKITVAEEVNDWGQQVFVFSLPNGRRLKMDFCPHLINPDGNACCAVTTAEDQAGERVSFAVNSSLGSEKQSMESVNLWFSSDEEDERHGQMLSEELNSLNEELRPIIQEINKNEKHKNN